MARAEPAMSRTAAWARGSPAPAACPDSLREADEQGLVGVVTGCPRGRRPKASSRSPFGLLCPVRLAELACRTTGSIFRVKAAGSPAARAARIVRRAHAVARAAGALFRHATSR